MLIFDYFNFLAYKKCTTSQPALLVQSQLSKYQNNEWDLFEIVLVFIFDFEPVNTS